MAFYLTCVAIGCAMGFFSGLLGVGGGILAIPAMIHFLNMDPQKAMGTSLAIIIPVAISGAIKQYQQHNINLEVFLLIALGGIAFGYLGAHVNGRMDPFWLKRCFAIFLIAIGVKMLWDAKPKNPEATARAEAPTITVAAK